MSKTFSQSSARWFRFKSCWCALLLISFYATGPASLAHAQNVTVQPDVNAAQYRYWTTQWSFDNVDVQNLLNRLENLGIEVPVAARGNVSFQFDVSVPLNALSDARAYRFEGTFMSKQLQVENLLLANFRTDIRYRNGVIKLLNLSTLWVDMGTSQPQVSQPVEGELAEGNLTGMASLEVVPRGALSGELRAEQLAIAPLYDLILTASRQPGRELMLGNVSGTLNFSAPLNTIRLPATWSLDANLQGFGIAMGNGVPLTVNTGPISLRDGKLRASSVRLLSTEKTNAKMIASVSVDLVEDRPFEIDIKADDLPLESIASLTSLGSSTAVHGSLDIDAHSSGKLGNGDIADWEWNLAGRVASPEISIMGVQLGMIQHTIEFDPQRFLFSQMESVSKEKSVIERVSANYSIKKDTAELTNLEATAFGGTIRGSSFISRNASQPHRVQLNWSQIKPQINTAPWTSLPLNVSLQSSGEIDGSVPAESVNQPDAYRGIAKIEIENLLIGSEKVADGRLLLKADDTGVQLEGDGELLGGRFRVQTTTSMATIVDLLDFSANQPRGDFQGELQLSRVALSQLARFVKPVAARRFEGFVSGTLTLAPQPSFALPNIRASLTIEDAVLDGTLLTRRLNTELRTEDQFIIVESVRGNYAGGRIEVVGRIALAGGEGRLQVQLSSINASSGLKPFSDSASRYTSGAMSGRLTVETGRLARASGAIQIRDSHVNFIPLGDAHAGVVATANNDLSKWSLRFLSVESSLGNGRIRGEAELRSSTVRPGAFDLTSTWQAKRLDVGRLLNDAGGSVSSYARGDIDGKLALQGNGIRTTADLNGRFNADLGRMQARAVPGLINAQAYLGAFSLASTSFDQGWMRGSIGGGSARIDEFRLIGQKLQVAADGRVQIPSGRMEVTAVISTGNFDVENAVVENVAKQLAIGAAPPIAVFLEINRLLSNRTLYVDVLGPFSNPRLQLKPLKSLESELVRFAVREATSAFLPIVGASGLLATDPKP